MLPTIIRIFGFLFILIGAGWVGLGLYIEEVLILLGGALAATAGVVLLGLARNPPEHVGE